MKKHTIYIAITTLVILSCILMIPTPIFADVGHGVSYSDDSGSDGSGLIFIIYFLIRHPYLFLILFIIYFLLKKFTGFDAIKEIKKMLNPSTSSRHHIKEDKGSINRLKQKDPNFSDAAFISKVNNMFMQLQDSWMRKEWSTIRPFETDALFSMHERQLQQLIDRNHTNVIQNIGILHTEIMNYQEDEMNDTIDVKIEARFNDFIIDDYSQQVVQGNPNKEVYMTYVWTLIRKNGVLTDTAKSELQASQCPNCGANVSVSQSGQCEYCDSVVTSGEYDWILSKIQIVNQTR